MKEFIRKNRIALLLVLAANMSELTYFIKIPWLKINEAWYTLGELLYYLVCQLGYINFLPSLILYKLTKNKDSKGIYLGLVVWNCFELLQELNLVLRLNIPYILKNNMLNATVLQIIFINFTVILMYYGNKKWST